MDKRKRLKLASPYEIRKALSRVANMALTGRLTPRVEHYHYSL